jgi:ribosomal protein L24
VALQDGMLLKEVRPIAVNPFQANPTIDEMKRFEPRKSARGDEDETENRLKAADDALHSLSATGPSSRNANTTYVSGVASADVGALLPGDNVVVVKGDLSNLQGRVVAVAGNTFTMQPTGETAAELGMTSMLEMPCDEVLKTFEPGHKVRILGGPYIGETGTVVKVLFNERDSGDLETAWLASILLDSGLKSVQAFVRDLTRTSESRAAISEVEVSSALLLLLIPIPIYLLLCCCVCRAIACMIWWRYPAALN